MAEMKNYNVGLHNVGSYQVSGIPWISGSNAHEKNTLRVFQFPFVAKSVTVASSDADSSGYCHELRIHFNTTAQPSPATVLGKHDFVLSGNLRQVTLNAKCTEIYVSTPDDEAFDRKYRVFAELTQIPAQRMFALTGSGLTTPILS